MNSLIAYIPSVFLKREKQEKLKIMVSIMHSNAIEIEVTRARSLFHLIDCFYLEEQELIPGKRK